MTVPVAADAYFTGRTTPTSGEVAIEVRTFVGGSLNLVSSTADTATFRWQGDARFGHNADIVYPPPARPLSEFYVTSLANLADYPFDESTNYYLQSPPSPADKTLVIFRIDSTDTTPQRKINVWIKGQGWVVTDFTASIDMGNPGTIFPFDLTFTIPKTGDTIPVLYMGSGHSQTTGATLSGDKQLTGVMYSQWFDNRTFSYTFDTPPTPTTYRPGAVYNGTTFKSCNGTNGKCNIYNGTQFVEMTTEAGGTDNPPLIYTPNGWKNMGKTGSE